MIGDSMQFDESQQNTDAKSRIIPRAISGPQFPTVQVTNRIEKQDLVPNFSYGKSTVGKWEKLDNNAEAKPGDILRLTFTMSIPYFMDWQREFIVDKLNRDDRFVLRSVQLNEEIRKIVIEVELVKNFSPAFLVPVVIIGLLAGALIVATTVSIEKLSTVQIGDFKIKGTPFIFLAILGVAVFFVIRRG